MSAPEPHMDNGGRWDHIASDAEIETAMRDHSAIIIEAPVISTTFIVSTKHMTVLRAGAMGGDVRSVEGGWVYANPFSLMRDEQELRQIAGVYTSR